MGVDVDVCGGWRMAGHPQMKELASDNEEELRQFYDSFDTFVFDCDGAYMASSNTVSRAHACEGVLWRGNVLIDGIKELFQMLNRDV